ncbi:MAG: GIDE domain-containing protein [Kofleriaceae bacterium]
MWWHHEQPVPLARIDELGLLEGQIARVVGRAVGLGEDVEAPYSMRKCFAVTSRMDLMPPAMTADRTGGVQSVDGPVMLVKFAVEDGAGRIVVDPDAVKLELALHVALDKHEVAWGGLDAKPAFGASIINRELDAIGGTGGMRIALEGVIAPGDLVAIIGRVQRAGDSWELVPPDDEKPVIISRHPEQLV